MNLRKEKGLKILGQISCFGKLIYAQMRAPDIRYMKCVLNQYISTRDNDFGSSAIEKIYFI